MTGSRRAAPNVELDDLKRVLERKDILAAVKRGIIDHARGMMVSPVPGGP